MIRTPAAFAALAFALVPAGALARGILTIGFAATPYTVAGSCNLAQPLVSLNVAVRNTAGVPSDARTLVAIDQSGVLQGSAPLPSLDPGEALALVIPLRAPGMNPAAIGGSHAVTVTAGSARSAPQVVQIPAALCAPAPPSAAPAPPAAAGPPAAGTIKAVATAPRARLVVATPAPRPQSIGSVDAHTGALAAGFAVSAPSSLRAAAGATDCVAHVGAFGALVCPDMVKNGGLLLVWDWQAGIGPGAIDGFRVYRVDGGRKQLVDTVGNKNSQTLSNVPPPAGGYNGKCYAATAFAGTRESALSSAFCSGAGATATTVRLPLMTTRSSAREQHNSTFYAVPDSGMIVGFTYTNREQTLGDAYQNTIYRVAVAFNVSSLANRRLVAAKLHMPIAQSFVTVPGIAPNHSCASEVGAGTGVWWKNHDWLDGQFDFGIAPTDTGPDITADVTPIVAAWLRGEPNLGLVLKTDENLGAFANVRCETFYANPTLEVTYY